MLIQLIGRYLSKNKNFLKKLFTKYKLTFKAGTHFGISGFLVGGNRGVSIRS
jgi:hypothetical protein